MMTEQCGSRSPSGRLCDRLDGHDGDHLSADQRAWATAYEDKSTIDLTGRRPTAFPLEEQFIVFGQIHFAPGLMVRGAE